MKPQAKVVSFVLRFVYEEPETAVPGPARGWHSSIRHVQSDTEQRCARWEEIEAFVAQYIDLEKGNGHE